MARDKRDFDCLIVGEEMADIVGIGIVVGIVGQAAISLFLAGWVFLFSKLGYLDVHHHDVVDQEKEDEEGMRRRAADRKRLEIVSEILMVGNDIQVLLGISYMVTVFSSVASMDTYHLHLVYDIVSFVGVSNASALVCWTFCAAKLKNEPKHKHPEPSLHGRPQSRRSYIKRHRLFARRYRVAYVFALLFLALTILLCIRLDEWSPAPRPGRCYDARLVSTPPHPTTDKIYVAITASWLLIVMALAVFLGARRRRLVLTLSFLQFPVHLYMAIALRCANQGRLEGAGGTGGRRDGNENRWDFGQTTAVLLLAVAVTELISKGREYLRFKEQLKREGLSRMSTRARADDGEADRDDDKEGRNREEEFGEGNDGGLIGNDIRIMEEQANESHQTDG